ncbi:MAG: hypothetical protein ABR553_06370 [Gammaproteobacteria bacterium]
MFGQVYGDTTEVRWLVEPLKQLLYGVRPEDGALTQLVNRVRLYCVSYDPATGGYRLDYSIYLGMAIGAMIILGVSGFLLRELRLPRRT